jgi:hypothetical protein
MLLLMDGEVSEEVEQFHRLGMVKIMMNRMELAVQQLINRMLDNVPVNIIYHRGTASTNIVCWIGQTAFRLGERSNSRLVWSDRDYMIP